MSLESLGRTEDAAKGLKSLIAAYPEIPEPVYLALALECYEAAAPALESNAELQSRLRTLKRISGR